MKKVGAFVLGVREWRHCVEQGNGVTYDDPELSEAYDRGVNLGQNVAEVRRALRHPLAQHFN